MWDLANRSAEVAEKPEVPLLNTRSYAESIISVPVYGATHCCSLFGQAAGREGEFPSSVLAFLPPALPLPWDTLSDTCLCHWSTFPCKLLRAL